MMRGYTWFRCPVCGTKFEAPDIELLATATTMPQHCPKCHAESPAAGPAGQLVEAFRDPMVIIPSGIFRRLFRRVRK